MTTRQVLKEALAIVTRDHTSTQLAVTEHGVKCQPLSPTAVAWSSTGALCKVAPSHAEHGPQHTFTAFEAYGLLTEAARAQGYLNVASVDVAGVAAVQRCFWRALQSAEPEKRRRRSAPGTGAQPRGIVA